MPSVTIAAAPFGTMNPQVLKMMEQLSKGYYNFLPSETWTPNVNLYETDTDYHVCVDLAGVDKDKIDIAWVDQRLMIRGQRLVPQCPSIPQQENATGDAEQARMRVHLMEIDHGAFAREVELPPDVDKQAIAARYVEGMLWIDLPKK